MNNIEGFIILLTYLGVTSSAVSGVLEARKHEMDVVGATTVAFVTAFGGGTLRDLLLGRTPIFWLVDPGLSIATFAVSIIFFFRVHRISEEWLYIPDALGLGFFTILGATFALQMALSLLVVSLMGVVTGVFGASCVMSFATRSPTFSNAAHGCMPPALFSACGCSSF